MILTPEQILEGMVWIPVEEVKAGDYWVATNTRSHREFKPPLLIVGVRLNTDEQGSFYSLWTPRAIPRPGAGSQACWIVHRGSMVLVVRENENETPL